MRICAFSDIHGNAHILEKALPVILKINAQMNVCLGDSCGYYPDFPQVVSMLKEVPRLHVLRGNHEQMFMNAIDLKEGVRENYLKRYGPALELFLQNPEDHLIEWLRALPNELVIKEKRLGFWHGSPLDHLNGYIYPDTDLGSIAKGDLSVIVLGHTHWRMARRLGDTLIVNPGSLGQPRDGHWPSIALIDTDNMTAEFHEIRFDRQEHIASIASYAQAHPYLVDVFKRINADE